MEHTRTPLRRRFVGAVASAAIALAGMTATALPARADNNDLARALAAIAALAIIAKAIDNNRDKGNDEPNDWDNGGHGPRPPPVYNPPRPHPVPVPQPARNVLPRECAIELIDRGRRAVWYSRPCLQENGLRADLPRRCAAEVRIRGRDVTVYRQGCLVDAGFRTERGRRNNW